MANKTDRTTETKIVTLFLCDNTSKFFNMIRKEHQLSRSEMVRTLFNCANHDQNSDHDYDFSVSLVRNEGEEFNNKIQAHISVETYQGIKDLMSKHDMKIQPMMRRIVDTLVTDYFLQTIEEMMRTHDDEVKNEIL